MDRREFSGGEAGDLNHVGSQRVNKRRVRNDYNGVERYAGSNAYIRHSDKP